MPQKPEKPQPDPRASTSSVDSAPPACPFCASTDTELFALFGQNLLSSQYYCRNCRTVFEAVRWEGE